MEACLRLDVFVGQKIRRVRVQVSVRFWTRILNRALSPVFGFVAVLFAKMVRPRPVLAGCTMFLVSLMMIVI